VTVRSLRLRRGKLRSTWYAKWRDASGGQHEDGLGLLWEDKGDPRAG
jgi:integrase